MLLNTTSGTNQLNTSNANAEVNQPPTHKQSILIILYILVTQGKAIAINDREK